MRTLMLFVQLLRQAFQPFIINELISTRLLAISSSRNFFNSLISFLTSSIISLFFFFVSSALSKNAFLSSSF